MSHKGKGYKGYKSYKGKGYKGYKSALQELQGQGRASSLMSTPPAAID